MWSLEAFSYMKYLYECHEHSSSQAFTIKASHTADLSTCSFLGRWDYLWWSCWSERILHSTCCVCHYSGNVFHPSSWLSVAFRKSPHWKDVESLWLCQSKSTGGAALHFVCVECDTAIKRKGPLIRPWGTQDTHYAFSDSEIQPHQESEQSLKCPLSSQSHPIKVVFSCCEHISSIHFFLIIILWSSKLPNRGRRHPVVLLMWGLEIPSCCC